MQRLCYAHSKAHKIALHWMTPELQACFMTFSDSQVLLIHVRAADKPLLFDLGEAAGIPSRVVKKPVFLKAFYLFL